MNTTEILVVRGGEALEGAVRVAGAVNTVLPIMAAAALAPDVSVIENVPHCRDVLVMADILRALGCQVEVEGGICAIDARGLGRIHAPAELCGRIRGSYYAAGVLLARFRRFEVGLPGGDSIGGRPVDFHIRGFQALGAEVTTERGYMIGWAGEVRGAEFYVPRRSVGTTINLMLAATLARGTTVLHNAALEPEVTDTAVFLNLMGAHVRGAGTPTIVIEGVRELHGARTAVIPDRIEAGTYLIAGAATRGEVEVDGLIPEHVTALLTKLQEAGCEIEANTDRVRVRARRRLRAVDIDTAPFPGFATDLHPPFVAMLATAEGEAVIRETIYEGRMGYAYELVKMGADIRVEGNVAYLRGVERLTGAAVQALDIRGGAAMVVAGLVAEGVTEIHGVEHIDRKYEGLDEKLRGLGADVRRVTVAGSPVLAMGSGLP
ncbi:MAG: UDP-N-acetylglucosamine 1-carboxyvinyltransferase [Armatimonadota bacterium]|nr:UDP-N-acetylglucosamine 1-carboxyvinyltransferase [Armatimonadota bacterium]MDR7439531.1 UDP-N-acetylglucosamine 1-carboxyvinyltransferase [Armatimonadota bacterium]MDR7443234.1 UDP-N-acetylglucosamine 1-carboxyvinyltransferase [Armatimonadota bacterium]MDR7563449.1 UDP-N-acetylglucosamine 1-carboxyvinyltransferase [Armatimonadota bacterium]MDR7567494.1 UDP-N-acetylglucosamine 1-carboxyvinyltransferase [Armatimonadota bacterium]